MFAINLSALGSDMNNKEKKFFPKPGTQVLITVDHGLPYEKQMELIFLEIVSFGGFSPDAVKFLDESDNSIVIVRYRDIYQWRYSA